MRAELSSRCNSIEEAYEFMLAYAAQGLESDRASGSGAQLREFLRRSDDALAGLADLFRRIVATEHLQPAERYHAFIDVLDRDAHDAQAAIQLVLAQPAISSQLVDNLNASIHLRALLTDLFLIDELLKARSSTEKT
ncbi:MAG TPA: hypothetical protein VGQ10_09485 [Vicinamibacterales bacterium]|jgi:hypothetical protein|nr:hypothetical protein [Vicinamibacterales bacterium]